MGVGFLGGGAVTQAIHLPALSRLTDLFTVRVVMDVSETTASTVADRVGARSTTSMDEVLNDESVDVVVVCSPPQFHAEHVIAACRAGKQAVLCEKPFTTTVEEATRIAQVSSETGVPVIVGTMHAYDPGWLAFAEAWGPMSGSAHHIRCSAVLPPNPRFEDFATEVTNRDEQAPASPASVDDLATLLRGGILGLATHDLPLIRRFLTAADRIVVHTAQTLTPFGYLIVFSCGDQVVELHALMSANWDPRWSLEVYSEDRVGTVDFTPSYVQAGSATSVIQSHVRHLQLGPFDHNGYVEEWRQLHHVAHGHPPRYQTSDLIADLTFALDLSAGAEAALLGAHASAGLS
jgi:predicted dehydrogenase